MRRHPINPVLPSAHPLTPPTWTSSRVPGDSQSHRAISAESSHSNGLSIVWLMKLRNLSCRLLIVQCLILHSRIIITLSVRFRSSAMSDLADVQSWARHFETPSAGVTSPAVRPCLRLRNDAGVQVAIVCLLSNKFSTVAACTSPPRHAASPRLRRNTKFIQFRP